MSTLSALRTQLQILLMDTGAAIWDTDTLDQALRQALSEYTQSRPLQLETVLTLPSAGREIALAALAGLLQVTEAWWPYDSAASVETWPPNRIRGFRLQWDDASPLLVLDFDDSAQPQEDDEIRLWYTVPQRIQDLDGADSTTVQADHEALLVLGAAGHAALSRVADLIETAGTDMYAIGLLGVWGNQRLREFRAQLKEVRQSAARQGPAYGPKGWKLDKWDT